MKDEKFSELVSQYLDHEISPSDLADLQQAIATDRAKLDAFQAYVRIHSAEQAIFGNVSMGDESSLRRVRRDWDPVAEEAKVSKKFVFRSAAFCGLITVAVVVGCQWLFLSDGALQREVESAAPSSTDTYTSSVPKTPVALIEEQFGEGTETVVFNLLIRSMHHANPTESTSILASQTDGEVRVFTFSNDAGFHFIEAIEGAASYPVSFRYRLVESTSEVEFWPVDPGQAQFTAMPLEPASR